MSFWKRVPRDDAEARPFSLRDLARSNPPLAAYFTWDTNPLPPLPPPFYVQLGCGDRVLDGFLNLDFLPHDGRVHAWNLLDLWPESWVGVADGVFSEDVLEHFFHGEQAYILCNVNRALREGGVARTLMPSLSRLVDYGAAYSPSSRDVMYTAFGVDTGGDALNMGMRFGGHRWLHTQQSLARLAAMCGFEAEPTTCARSSVAKFVGINLRGENDSLAFANDLRKTRDVARTNLAPEAIVGARHVEEVSDGMHLFTSTVDHPTVRYVLPAKVDASSFACLNVRSTNLSSFLEHSQKWLAINEERRDNPWHFDETQKSRPCMNVVTRNQLRAVSTDVDAIASFTFSPAARSGEHFVIGCAEVFVLA
jgi:predicted SAM-dependent methyltransferase